MNRRPLRLPDFTPMADLAWLLLAFFALMWKEKPAGQVIDLPRSSISEIRCGYSPDVRIYISAYRHLNLKLSQDLRAECLEMLAQRGIANDPEQLQNYSDPSLMESGQGIAPFHHQPYSNPSKIKANSMENLFLSIDFLRSVRKKLSFALYADQNLSYETIQEVLDGLSVRGIHRINLVTYFETDPTASI